MFDIKAEHNKQIWSLRDLKGSAAQQCFERPAVPTTLTDGPPTCESFLNDDHFLLIKVPPLQKAGSEPEANARATLVVVDVATGKFVDIPWAKVQESSKADAPFYALGELPQFQSSSFTLGATNLESMLLAVSNRSVIDVYRVRGGNVSYFGTYVG